MLNIWKRTWKGKDFEITSGQTRLHEPAISTSSLDVTAAVHPSDSPSFSPLSPEVSIAPKRYGPQDESGLEPDHKKQRACKIQYNLAGNAISDETAFEDRVLWRAKKENSNFKLHLLYVMLHSLS